MKYARIICLVVLFALLSHWQLGAQKIFSGDPMIYKEKCIEQMKYFYDVTVALFENDSTREQSQENIKKSLLTDSPVLRPDFCEKRSKNGLFSYDNYVVELQKNYADYLEKEGFGIRITDLAVKGATHLAEKSKDLYVEVEYTTQVSFGIRSLYRGKSQAIIYFPNFLNPLTLTCTIKQILPADEWGVAENQSIEKTTQKRSKEKTRVSENNVYKVEHQDNPYYIAYAKAKEAEQKQLNIANYSTTKHGTGLTIELKFDKRATEDAQYLLYGHYSTTEKKNYTIMHPLKVTAGMDSYKYTKWGVDSLISQINDLSLIKESNKDDYVDITIENDRRKIKNKSNKIIALVVYTSSGSYRTEILGNSETFLDSPRNGEKILVFDTGESQNIKEIPLYERINIFLSNMNVFEWSFFIIAIFGYFMITFLGFIFVNELIGSKSIFHAWNKTNEEVGLHAFINACKGESIWVKLWLSLPFISPLFALLFTVYLFISI